LPLKVAVGPLEGDIRPDDDHPTVLVGSTTPPAVLLVDGEARWDSWRLRHPMAIPEPGEFENASVLSDRRALRVGVAYESSAAEAFGNLPSSPAYLSPAFLKAVPSSMNFRC
jgi:hypothetical protein